MLVKPHAGQAAKIKVVGVGGGGGNAITSMILEGGIPGVEFVAVNTDAQALLHNKAEVKIQIGDALTKGLGSGGDPEVGKQAAEESRDKIKEELNGADMVFITAGMGGGTGTGAAPVLAEIAKEVGALTVAVVTKPFIFEMARRRMNAEDGIGKLTEHVDTLIIVPNQKILQVIDKKTPLIDAFKQIDSVLHQGVKGIAELITLPGLINVDFADVKTVMSNAGTALMGIGQASGEKRALAAMKQAISSPLLDTSIEGARGILFNVVGGADLTMAEIDEAASIIAKAVDPDADVIFGSAIDEKMVDQIKVTLIATKFDDSKRSFAFRQRTETKSLKESLDEAQGTADDFVTSLHEPAEDVFGQQTHTPQPKSSGYRSHDSGESSSDDPLDIPAFMRKR